MNVQFRILFCFLSPKTPGNLRPSHRTFTQLFTSCDNIFITFHIRKWFFFFFHTFVIIFFNAPEKKRFLLTLLEGYDFFLMITDNNRVRLINSTGDLWFENILYNSIKIYQIIFFFSFFSFQSFKIIIFVYLIVTILKSQNISHDNCYNSIIIFVCLRKTVGSFV